MEILASTVNNRGKIWWSLDFAMAGQEPIFFCVANGAGWRGIISRACFIAFWNRILLRLLDLTSAGFTALLISVHENLSSLTIHIRSVCVFLILPPLNAKAPQTPSPKNTHIQSSHPQQSSIHSRRRRRSTCIPTPSIRTRSSANLPLFPLLRRKRIIPTHQHTTHHIHHRVTLTRDFNRKVHLPDLRQGFLPIHFFQMCGVVGFQLFEEVCGTALDG